MTIPAGKTVVDLIEFGVAADQPVMLIDPHGIGKSSLFEAAAQHLGIGVIVCDLSLMESVDLVGIPRIDSEFRTIYAPPAFLPRTGKGLFVLEELNRAPRHVQVPALQLLTARRLNDFVFPPGWLPCAAINDGEEYFVDTLDPALLSRFMKARINADVVEWCQWARSTGNVHSRIVEFAEQTPSVFENPDGNPRAWTYASNILKQWELNGQNQDLIAAALAGVVGEHWAVAFLQYYGVGAARPLTATQIIQAYRDHRHVVIGWLQSGRLDIVVASLELLKRHLQRQADFDAAVGPVDFKNNLEAFFSDLLGDVKRSLRTWVNDRGFNKIKVPSEARQ